MKHLLLFSSSLLPLFFLDLFGGHHPSFRRLFGSAWHRSQLFFFVTPQNPPQPPPCCVDSSLNVPRRFFFSMDDQYFATPPSFFAPVHFILTLPSFCSFPWFSPDGNLIFSHFIDVLCFIHRSRLQRVHYNFPDFFTTAVSSSAPLRHEEFCLSLCL